MTIITKRLALAALAAATAISALAVGGASARTDGPTGRYEATDLRPVAEWAAGNGQSGMSPASLRSAASAAGRQVASVHDQGETGNPDAVAAEQGATIVRSGAGIEASFRLTTPTTGTYEYPTADMVPDGAPEHPTPAPGDAEVFTLWAFVFNNPTGCTDPCNGDDLGPTAAQGGVYQLDATIGYDRRIHMDGDIWTTSTPFAGMALSDPLAAEVHLAMAPHGGALSGADLTRQLNGPIGTPAHWWTAVFEADDANSGRRLTGGAAVVS